jgi:hypothetical protein
VFEDGGEQRRLDRQSQPVAGAQLRLQKQLLRRRRCTVARGKDVAGSSMS